MPGGNVYSGYKTGSGQPVPMMSVVPGGPQIPDINAIVGQMVDRGKWYYYDTLKIPPGATVGPQYRFFTNGNGQPDPNNGNLPKTDLETNLPGLGSAFPPPYDLILNNLGFYFTTDTTLYDINQIMKYSWFEFKILEKTFFKGHLWRHPPGAGVNGHSTGIAAPGEHAWTNGIAAPAAVWSFGDWAKYIAPLMTFSLTINFPETVSGFLNGVLGASATANTQAVGTLPTLNTAAQQGNGVTLIAIMQGLTDRAVQ